MSKSTNKTRVAVIGAGNMGKNHLRNYFLLPEVELVGLADIDPSAEALASEYGAQFFTSYTAMLDSLKPDAVSIVVPTPLHAEVATEVMSRGIHCMLEKPIASSVAEANERIKLADDNKVIFTVGHIEHYNPLVVELKSIIKAGTLGDITSIVCKRVGGFPEVEPKSDVIIDLAVHDIGLISFLLEKQPQKIYSHGSRTHHSNAIDSAEILMDYGDASGFIQSNWLTPVKIRTIAITGSGGYVEGNYITQELELYEHNMDDYKNEGFSKFVKKMGDAKKRVVKVDFKEPLAIELKSFIAKINGDETRYLVDAASARDALDLALRSLNNSQAG